MHLFNKIFLKNDNHRKKYNKKQAQFMAEQWIRIIKDCVNIVNSTKNPEIFFSRYNLMIEKAELMVSVEHLIKTTGNKPSQSLQMFNEQKESSINDLIDRYYQETLNKIAKLTTSRGKINNIERFYNELESYKKEMTINNINYYTKLYNDLKIKI